MNSDIIITHEFVEYMPDELKERTVYVSIAYSTAIHMCLCGCGNKVVTPLSPTDWRLVFDGETISLYPSIGNWSFDCRSHYWIRNNRVKWDEDWSQKEVEAGREQDKVSKEKYFKKTSSESDHNRDTGENKLDLKKEEDFWGMFWRKKP